ncbi:MAG: WYL domain-containing protein [Firmicutes bacterium]|nr:WYL domain-containing protein [Bacillota bacterium]
MSEKRTDQALKLLVLQALFLEETDEEHALSIADITEVLRSKGIHADRKTLYRDFDILRRSGLDILRMQDGRTVRYYVGNRHFELPELKLLVDAVQSSRFITKKKSDALIGKIESLTSRYEACKLDRQVYVADRVKTDNEVIYYTVDLIHHAVNSNRSVEFQYYNWTVDKQKKLRHDGALYRVSPWALLWDNQNYYLIGFDEPKEEIRHYRVDKIVNLRVTEEERSGRDSFESFDVVSYTTRLFGMFDGEEREVTLQVEPALIGIFFDRFGTDIPVRSAVDGREIPAATPDDSSDDVNDSAAGAAVCDNGCDNEAAAEAAAAVNEAAVNDTAAAEAAEPAAPGNSATAEPAAPACTETVEPAAENPGEELAAPEPAQDSAPAFPEDEPVEITVSVTVSDQFLGWILSLGNGVKITGPEDVTARIRRLLEERSRLY